jgi:hypothetical protein
MAERLDKMTEFFIEWLRPYIKWLTIYIEWLSLCMEWLKQVSVFLLIDTMN